MADSSLPIGVILLILLGFEVVVYYLSKLEEKFTTQRDENLELESLKTSKELDSVADLINNDPTVKIQILENRCSLVFIMILTEYKVYCPCYFGFYQHNLLGCPKTKLTGCTFFIQKHSFLP